MIIAIFGPEFVLTIASGQWASAHRSVAAFHSAGFSNWSLKHSFYADMGGIHLKAPDMPAFPINSKQLYYLVQQRYISLPEIDVREISDKSKADTVAKTVTFFQSFWLLCQCLGRWEQNLALTTLELSAVAIVVCTIGTFICWLHKPLDVRVPLILQIEHTISDILINGGDAARKPYWQTPLDFIDNLGPSWSANIMPHIHLPSLNGVKPAGTGPSERPIQRITNDRFPDLSGWRKALLFFVTNAYASIHMCGWSFQFPSALERILWRTCSTILFVSTFLYWVFETAAAWHRVRRWQRWCNSLFYSKSICMERNARLDNKPVKEHTAVLPLWWELALISPLWVIYTSARIYLIVEVFMGLRITPVSAFESVRWADYVPHV